MSGFVLMRADTSVGGDARRRPTYFRTKKVAFLGATESLRFAPWHDDSWTFVAHPCCRPRCKREPDWYHDMHRRECFTQRKGWNREYYDWLKRLQTPIFMQEDWADIPMAVRYPIERIRAQFRSTATGRLYATNHVAYMIALAMTEGVQEIGLFGCQYHSASEHGVQRDSLTYWLGRFEQAGGRIVIPDEHNTVLSYPRGLYGYESHDEHGKLVDEYRATPADQSKVLVKANAEKHAPLVREKLQPLTVGDGSTLAVPPDGEPIAWERLTGHAAEMAHA